MAVKSIIDVDVNDEAFKRFEALFSQYEAKVKDLPGEWKKVDEAIAGAGKRFASANGPTSAMLAGMAASAGVIAESIHKATKAQRDFQSATRQSHNAMRDLGAAAGKVSHTIFGLGKWMLKFGTMGGALAGVGGAIGLDDLAGSALSRQRSARGIGMTPGQAAAFSTYFSQFGNADAVAANVANARNDITKRWVFSGIGISQSELQHDSNFKLSIDVEKKMQAALKKMPRADWQNIARARGFDLIASTDEMRRWRHTSIDRMNAAGAGARSSVNALGFSNTTAREWSSLQIQMHKARVEIESSLITGLHRLAPELTKVSGDIARWISAFAKGPEMGKWVTDAEHGLQVFTKYLGSPQFQKNLLQFQHDMGTAASEMLAIAKDLYPYAKAAGWVAKGAEDIWNANPLGLNKITPEQAYRAVRRSVGMGDNNPGDIMHKNQFGRWVNNRYATTTQGIQAMDALLKRYPKEHHANTLASIIPIWNGHGKNDPEYIRRVSRWSGIGPDQPLDMNNKAQMAKVIAAMSREEGTHPVTREQAAVALGAQPGLPASVNRLVDTLRRQKPARPQHVTIRNQTSARVALQANAASY
ncbi:hypothetical protein [Acidiphilium sp. PM]|uniref:hypothetical protein n=1 Tax=Acidiphilium sp. PM TaxID=1043206 RepID=UPI0002144C7A|nr:hypothetical protein [Acidiphilium sp. PM]EGO96799.1 hypothetical protein APM_0301 [Acidiphilium sp. PM]